ncbi:YceI family protein [Flavobacteriaceae bacterium LMO-SS05]
MKKLFFALCFSAVISLSAQSTWKVDAAHSNINFSISHLLISEVTGNFGTFDIQATADDAFNDPSFTVSIQTASINTGNEHRDKDLRSDGYFNAEVFPAIEFKTTNAKKTGDNTFILTGDFTMHGITKSIDLNGKLNGIITDRRSGKLKAGLKFTGMVKRSDFEIGGSMAPIGNEVNIHINLEMAQQ